MKGTILRTSDNMPRARKSFEQRKMFMEVLLLREGDFPDTCTHDCCSKPFSYFIHRFHLL